MHDCNSSNIQRKIREYYNFNNIIVTTLWILYKLDYYEPLLRRVRSFKTTSEKNKVGIIADDEVFNYSIMRYDQNSFEFIQMEKFSYNTNNN